MEEINDAIQMITDNTNHMNEIAEFMQNNSQTSSAALQELQASTEETITAIDGIVNMIDQTNRAVNSISEAIDIINSIADIHALVIGNEGSGVSRLAKEKCDMIASIPMKGDIDSLNASVATGVLAFEIVRQRLSK